MAEQVNKQALNRQDVIWISVAFALGTLIVGAAIAFFIHNSQYVLFRDNDSQIQIKYPKNWTVKKQFAGTIVTFVSPKDDELDSFAENLNISVSDIPPHVTTLEQFSRIATGQVGAVFEGDIEVVRSGAIEFAGFPAYSYVMRTTQFPEMNLRFVWFFKDNKAYVITCVAQTLMYKKHLGTFNDMLRSFSIGEK